MNVKIDIQDLKYMLDNTQVKQNVMLPGRHEMKLLTLFLGRMSEQGELIAQTDIIYNYLKYDLSKKIFNI